MIAESPLVVMPSLGKAVSVEDGMKAVVVTPTGLPISVMSPTSGDIIPGETALLEDGVDVACIWTSVFLAEVEVWASGEAVLVVMTPD